MFNRPATAVLSLFAFVAGGWLPAVMHGPAVVHDLHTQCSHGVHSSHAHSHGVHSHAADSANPCGHDHAQQGDHARPDAPSSDGVPADDHDCAVCELLATAASPPVAPVRPIRCEAVTCVIPAAKASVAVVSIAPRLARGPPTV